MAAVAPAAGAAMQVERLICGNLRTFASRLVPCKRIAGLDVTASHLAISISDTEQKQASPFGIIARSGDTQKDSRILRSALTHTSKLQPGGDLAVCAAVIGVAPGAPPFDYVRKLLDLPDLFPGLTSLLYYSEPHVLLRRERIRQDFIEANKAMPEKLGKRRRNRHQLAMYPQVAPEDMIMDRTARASISATDILQAALDDLRRLRQEEK